MTYPELPAITKITPTNHFPGNFTTTALYHIHQLRRLPHVKFHQLKRSRYGKRASQSSITTSGKFK